MSVSTDLQIKMDDIVLVEEGHSFQNLPHEPLHIFITEGLILSL